MRTLKTDARVSKQPPRLSRRRAEWALLWLNMGYGYGIRHGHLGQAVRVLQQVSWSGSSRSLHLLSARTLTREGKYLVVRGSPRRMELKQCELMHCLEHGNGEGGCADMSGRSRLRTRVRELKTRSASLKATLWPSVKDEADAYHLLSIPHAGVNVQLCNCPACEPGRCIKAGRPNSRLTGIR